eukprot:gene7884-13767_t
MSDLHIVESQDLPGVEKLHTYFLDLSAAYEALFEGPTLTGYSLKGFQVLSPQVTETSQVLTLNEVNAVRQSIFWQKFNKIKQIVNLIPLPPCKANLIFHMMRSNYVAFLYRNADTLIISHDDPVNHGWDNKGRVTWSNESYPENVCELLIPRDKENNEFNYEIDSDEFEEDLDEDIKDISQLPNAKTQRPCKTLPKPKIAAVVRKTPKLTERKPKEIDSIGRKPKFLTSHSDANLLDVSRKGGKPMSLEVESKQKSESLPILTQQERIPDMVSSRKQCKAELNGLNEIAPSRLKVKMPTCSGKRIIKKVMNLSWM